MAKICPVLLVTLLLYIYWLPSGDAEEKDNFEGTFSVSDYTSWPKKYKIKLLNYVVEVNETVVISSPVLPVPKGVHWDSLSMENEWPASSNQKFGLAYSHYFDKFLKTYNKSWESVFNFDPLNRHLKIKQVYLGYADMYRVHVDGYKDSSGKKMSSADIAFDVAITLMVYMNHQCEFRGRPQSPKQNDTLILSCSVVVSGLWNTSLIFRNIYGPSETRGDVSKCGRQPSVGSRICSTVNVKAEVDILHYTCALEFSSDRRQDPRNPMFQNSKWTSKFNKEVNCYFPKIYIEAIPSEVSFLCNDMPCEDTLEVGDTISCVSHGYPQPVFDLRITKDQHSASMIDKESAGIKQMVKHVNEIDKYLNSGGIVKRVLNASTQLEKNRNGEDGAESMLTEAPVPEATSLTAEESDGDHEATDEVHSLIEHFEAARYDETVNEENLTQLYDRIVKNYQFPDLQWNGNAFMDSDELHDSNGEVEETTSPAATEDMTEETQDMPQTDSTIEDITISVAEGPDGSREHDNDTNTDLGSAEEEGETVIPEDTTKAGSDGEDGTTEMIDSNVNDTESSEIKPEQDPDEREENSDEEGDNDKEEETEKDVVDEESLTTEETVSDDASEQDEDVMVTSESSESVEQIKGFEEYQVQEKDVGHIVVSCNVSNVLGWGSNDLHLQVSLATVSRTMRPTGQDEDQSLVTDDFEADKTTVDLDIDPEDPDKEPEDPDKEPEDPDKEPEDPDKEPEDHDKEPEDPDKEPKDPDKEPQDPDKEPQDLDKEPQDLDKEPQDPDKESEDPDKKPEDSDKEPEDPDKEPEYPDKEPAEYSKESSTESQFSQRPETEMEQQSSNVVDEYTITEFSVLENEGTQMLFVSEEDAPGESPVTDSGRSNEFEAAPEDKAEAGAAAGNLVLENEAADGRPVPGSDPRFNPADSPFREKDNTDIDTEKDTVDDTDWPTGQGDSSAGRHRQSVFLELFLFIFGVCLTWMDL